MKFRNQADLDAHCRSLLNEAQKVSFDQLMATGTWKTNKTLTSPSRETVCWMESTGPKFYVVGIGLDGKIERPMKGKTGVSFSSKTFKRVY